VIVMLLTLVDVSLIPKTHKGYLKLVKAKMWFNL